MFGARLHLVEAGRGHRIALQQGTLPLGVLIEERLGSPRALDVRTQDAHLGRTCPRLTRRSCWSAAWVFSVRAAAVSRARVSSSHAIFCPAFTRSPFLTAIPQSARSLRSSGPSG